MSNFNVCFQQAVINELQKLFHIPTGNFNVVLRELRIISAMKHANKENEPICCWMNDSINNMSTCVVSLPLENNTKIFQVEVPQLIYKLCTYLELHLNVVGLFRISGSHKRIAIIKEQLKNGIELSSENPHDVANIFSQLFRQFKTHLIPLCMNAFIEQVVELEKDRQKVATQLCCLLLPTRRLHTLMYILHFFHKVVSNAVSNKMYSSSLAAVFTPNLCEVNSNELGKTRSVIFKQQKFVQYLIDNYQCIGIVPPCVHDACTDEKSSYKDVSKIETSEAKVDIISKLNSSGRKSLADRLISSVRKKKTRASTTRGSAIKKKRGHSDSSSHENESAERPAKRRSLQGISDAVNPTKFNASASLDKPLQSNSISYKQERNGSGSTTCCGSSTRNKLVHPKPFSIGTSGHASSNEKTRAFGRINSTGLSFTETSRSRRPTFFKRIAGSLMSPAVRRKSMRRKGKRAKLNITAQQQDKKSEGSHAGKKELVDVSKMKEIRINDSITIFELNNSSLLEVKSASCLSDPPSSPANHPSNSPSSSNRPSDPPSPILTSTNVTRIYDSFDCLKEGEVHPLNLIPPESLDTSSFDISCRLEENGAPSPIYGPSRTIGFRSFDVLQNAESVELLDSSQKQEEYFETMLDAKLDMTGVSRSSVEKSLDCDSFHPEVDNRAIENPLFGSEKIASHSLTTRTIDSGKNTSIISEVCKSVLDELLEKVSSVPSKAMECNALRADGSKRAKPVPPLRKSSRKSLAFTADSYSIVEELHFESTEEACEKKDYGDEIYRSGRINSSYRKLAANLDNTTFGSYLEKLKNPSVRKVSTCASTDFCEITQGLSRISESVDESSKNFSNFMVLKPEKANKLSLKYGKNLTKPDTSSKLYQNSSCNFGRTPSWLVSGKVSAAVKHYNDLHETEQHTVKKLAPLPYRDIRKRKGSFKMGRPTGSRLKLDLPTQLELVPSSGISCVPKTPMPAVKAPLHPGLVDPASSSRSQHRRSKSLESIVDETKEFGFDDMPRSPSVPSIAGRLPSTPLRRHAGLQLTWNSHSMDFLDSSPAKKATPKLPRSRSPIQALNDMTML